MLHLRQHAVTSGRHRFAERLIHFLDVGLLPSISDATIDNEPALNPEMADTPCSPPEFNLGQERRDAVVKRATRFVNFGEILRCITRRSSAGMLTSQIGREEQPNVELEQLSPLLDFLAIPGTTSPPGYRVPAHRTSSVIGVTTLHFSRCGLTRPLTRPYEMLIVNVRDNCVVLRLRCNAVFFAVEVCVIRGNPTDSGYAGT